jgi:hypothetical protein
MKISLAGILRTLQGRKVQIPFFKTVLFTKGFLLLSLA